MTLPDTPSPSGREPDAAAAISAIPASIAPRRRGFRFGWLAMILVFIAMAGTPVVIALLVTLGH